MRLTVLGGWGSLPAPGGACSGYLIEHDGFRLLIDPGYATFPRLIEHVPALEVDAVLVSHGHADHCADLNPLLRARILGVSEPRPLEVHALPGALDAVLALDDWLEEVTAVRTFEAGDRLVLGPFEVETVGLPHVLPNAGFRIAAGGTTIAYTGDTAPTEDVARLAQGAGLFLCEATYAREVPEGILHLSARHAGEYAAAGNVGRLVLTHLLPETHAGEALAAAGEAFAGRIDVAQAGLVVDLP